MCRLPRVVHVYFLCVELNWSYLLWSDGAVLISTRNSKSHTRDFACCRIHFDCFVVHTFTVCIHFSRNEMQTNWAHNIFDIHSSPLALDKICDLLILNLNCNTTHETWVPGMCGQLRRSSEAQKTMLNGDVLWCISIMIMVSIGIWVIAFIAVKQFSCKHKHKAMLILCSPSTPT